MVGHNSIFDSLQNRQGRIDFAHQGLSNLLLGRGGGEQSCSITIIATETFLGGTTLEEEDTANQRKQKGQPQEMKQQQQ